MGRAACRSIADVTGCSFPSRVLRWTAASRPGLRPTRSPSDHAYDSAAVPPKFRPPSSASRITDTTSGWRMTIAGTMETWTGQLRASHDRVLAAAETGHDRAALLAHATAGRIVAAWTLAPAPHDPSTHLEATHARCRRCLERLVKWPSDAE